jgi:hypothetical protein
MMSSCRTFATSIFLAEAASLSIVSSNSNVPPS